MPTLPLSVCLSVCLSLASVNLVQREITKTFQVLTDQVIRTAFFFLNFLQLFSVSTAVTEITSRGHMNEEQTAHLVTSVLLSYSRIALLGTRTGQVDSLANRDKRLFAFNSICSSHSGPRRVKG